MLRVWWADVKSDEEYAALKRQYDDLRRSEAFLRIAVSKYFEHLDKAAVFLKADRARAAYDGAQASLKFLTALRSPPHLRTPIIEAVEILKKGLLVKPQEPSKDAIVQIFSAVTLDMLMESKPQPVLLDAAKRVVGNSASAANALINSRKKIKTQDDPKGSKKLFWEIKEKLLQDYPKREDAIARALKGVRAMRGERP